MLEFAVSHTSCDGITWVKLMELLPLQNYENLPHYLTESQWEILKSGTHEKASSCLFLLCWNLGLRCPTEGTFSMLLNLMELAKGSQTRMSSFQRYSAFAQLKENWKRFKGRKKGDDWQYHEYLECLPRDNKELPAEYYLLAYQDDTPVECRVLLAAAFSLLKKRVVCHCMT